MNNVNKANSIDMRLKIMVNICLTYPDNTIITAANPDATRYTS